MKRPTLEEWWHQDTERWAAKAANRIARYLLEAQDMGIDPGDLLSEALEIANRKLDEQAEEAQRFDPTKERLH